MAEEPQRHMAIRKMRKRPISDPNYRQLKSKTRVYKASAKLSMPKSSMGKRRSSARGPQKV